MGAPNLRASPIHSQPPIQEHVHGDEAPLPSQQIPLASRRQHYSEEQPRRKNTEAATPTSNRNTSTSGAKRIQSNKAEFNDLNSEDYLPPYLRSEDSKEPLATLKEQILNNSDVEAVTRRRRTNSLQRESDHSGRSMKAKKRLSLVSVASSNINGALRATGSAGGLMENTSTPGSKGKYST